MLAERADADDRAEVSLAPHVQDETRRKLGKNRAELDAWLAQPIGRLAAGEQALLRELGGVA